MAISRANTNITSTHAQGTIYSTSSLKAFLIDAQAALTTEDDTSGEAMEQIIAICQPHMYYSAGSAQTITVICDAHSWDATSLQRQIRNLGSTAGGANNFDLSSATVVDASALVAS